MEIHEANGYNVHKAMRYMQKEYEETWNNLKNNIMLHKYLEDKNLQKYIPRIFRKMKLHWK